MADINDGGPAFAAVAMGPSGDAHLQEGMSLRDWFAGQALAGLCANPGGPFQSNPMTGWGLTNCDEHTIARLAEDLADAMIACRSKAGGEQL